MKNKITNIGKLLTFMLLTIASLFSIKAQEVGVGADLVSRYIWRGLEIGNSPSLQPTISFGYGGFEIGAWGAYQLGRDASAKPSDEIDIYMSYGIELGSSSLDIIFTDYYFPNAGFKLGNFNNHNDADGPGGHVLEIGASLTLPESFPLTLAGYINFYNDKNNSVYLYTSYPLEVKEVDLEIFLGATPGGDALYYGTDKFNVINFGLTASKEIKITDDFSLPIFGSYIINPNQDIAHFIFGVSL